MTRLSCVGHGLERWLARRWARRLLVLAAVVAYMTLYLTHRFLPTATTPGWFFIWDQKHYLASARALSYAILGADAHWYPLGYPALGSFFYAALPRHPFLLPNLLAFVGIVVALARLFRRALSAAESWLLVGLCLASPLVMEHLLIPWNTTPTQACTYAIVLLLVARRPGRREICWAALWAGGIALLRPGDTLFVAPLFAAALLARGAPERWFGDAARALGIVSSAVALMLLANKAVFGVFWSTPYVKTVESIGFGVDGIALSAYSLLIEARTLYDIDESALLARYPWTALCLPGIWVLVQRWGWRALGLPLAALVTFLFYLSYRDFDAVMAFRFGTVHYLLWLLPLLTFCAYLAVREGWRRLRLRVFLPLALGPALAALCLGLELEPLAAKPTLRFAGQEPARAALLQDGDVDTALEQRFPRNDNTIVEARFAQPQRLRVVRLEGWMGSHLNYPAVEIDGHRLIPNADYRPAFGPRGLTIFLKAEHRGRHLRVRVRPIIEGAIRISEVRFSLPRFGFRSSVLGRLLLGS